MSGAVRGGAAGRSRPGPAVCRFTEEDPLVKDRRRESKEIPEEDSDVRSRPGGEGRAVPASRSTGGRSGEGCSSVYVCPLQVSAWLLLLLLL